MSYLPTSICIDCTMWVVNRDSSGIPDDKLESVTDPAKDYTGHWYPDGEPHFGKSPCHRCGDHLHGDRFDAYLLPV